MGTPGNARVEISSNPYTLTGDTYSGRSLLGLERRYTIPERIACTGTGTFSSLILPPTGVRLLITGFSVDWGAPPAANSSVSLEALMAGSAILGTSDSATFKAVGPVLRVTAGAAIGSIPVAHPTPMNIVTIEGDTSTSLFRVNQTTGAADQFFVTIYYSPLYAADLPC